MSPLNTMYKDKATKKCMKYLKIFFEGGGNKEPEDLQSDDDNDNDNDVPP